MTPTAARDSAIGAAVRHRALIAAAEDLERQGLAATDQRLAAELFEEAIIARAAALAIEATA